MGKSLNYIKTDARFSEDRKYRYWLFRQWSNEPVVLFIGLNPSTANENDDDPTIRRIVRFAEGFGFGGVYMMNCFPLVTPEPKDLTAWLLEKEVGSAPDENLAYITAKAQEVAEVVFAWGNFEEVTIWGRDKIFRGLFPRAKCLGKNQNGSPKHPLYLKADTGLIPYVSDSS